MSKKDFTGAMADISTPTMGFISATAEAPAKKTTKPAKAKVKKEAEAPAPVKVEAVPADKDKRGRLNLTVPMGLREDVEKIIRLTKYNSLNALIIDLMTEFRDANTEKLNKVNEWGE